MLGTLTHSIEINCPCCGEHYVVAIDHDGNAELIRSSEISSDIDNDESADGDDAEDDQ